MGLFNDNICTKPAVLHAQVNVHPWVGAITHYNKGFPIPT